MIRTRWMAVLAMATISTTAGSAMAQGRGGIGSGWGGIELLLNPIVQAELKMDGPSIDKARSAILELREKRNELNSQLEGLEGEDRSKRIEDLATAHADRVNRAIEELLAPGPLARFRQIDLQQRGATALTDPSVAKALRLSAEQSEKLTPILNHSVLLLREASAHARGDRRAAFDRVQMVRKETDAAAVALLDEEQKKTWRAMIGEPLDLNPFTRAAR